MSVQTEIDRLASAKAAIKTAIEGKGVTVPDATLLDGMAALIDGIEADGGANNIISGSFTLSDSLKTSSPLYIDVAFPEQEMPLMYCLYEDTSELSYNDTSHTVVSLRMLSAFRYEYVYPMYYEICGYNKANSSGLLNISQTTVYTSSGYANAGGVYGAMEISLTDNQIRFKPYTDDAIFIVGRTYRYLLCWGE